MTRDRLDQAKVVDELVIDKAHHRQHPNCKTLVCFVYDSHHRPAGSASGSRPVADVQRARSSSDAR